MNDRHSRRTGIKIAPRSLDAIAEALLLPSGIDGVYARTAIFEDVVTRLAAFISRHREPGTEVLRFPPVMSRRQLERSGYLKSFPHFLGCVCCLGGREADVRAAVERFEAGEDWTRRCQRRRSRAHVRPPAIRSIRWSRAAAKCRPKGLLFDVACDCFRREPSKRSRPAAIVPHARICLRRHAGADRRFPPALDGTGAGARRSAGLALAHRSRERSVLRPRRQAHGGEPDRAGAEIRAARSGALRARSRRPA